MSRSQAKDHSVIETLLGFGLSYAVIARVMSLSVSRVHALARKLSLPAKARLDDGYLRDLLPRLTRREAALQLNLSYAGVVAHEQRLGVVCLPGVNGRPRRTSPVR